tara:strand:- start:420 stop:596 length:177 start_codon:yes stop_codon:yes gene_type:complete
MRSNQIFSLIVDNCALIFYLKAPPFGGPLAQVAQLVEHSTENAGVGCSNQPLGTTIYQ